SLRTSGDAGKPVWSAGTRGSRADETRAIDFWRKSSHVTRPSHIMSCGDKITRRKLFAGAAAGFAVGAAGTSFAQSGPEQVPVIQPAVGVRAKGPIVWLDMDQQELDDAYTQSVYAPNMRQILTRCARNSELVRERLGAPKRLAYGPAPI